ncbi:unnamed protein product [Rotaria sp. Silwood1]|nr:unnamed protein product [Rotaria sp. Silwood1]CAF3848337.1 unnamed protein product [Rotaria sp. Silwood1]
MFVIGALRRVTQGKGRAREATHLYGGPQMIDRFVHEVARVLRPDGFFLWCDICYHDGSKRSIDYLTASGELLIQDKVDITSNVLHSLDITSKSHEEVIKRIIPSEQQEAYRVWAGLPGTIMYENMREGRMDYWRAVLQDSIYTNDKDDDDNDDMKSNSSESQINPASSSSCRDIDEFAIELGSVCKKCMVLTEEKDNDLVECHAKHHQKCHKPPVSTTNISDPRYLWCGAKCGKLINKRQQSQLSLKKNKNKE